MQESLNFLEDETNILIVEDESILAIEMEYTLESLGYSVSGIETSAKNAISHAKENKPDLILMDINLKGEESGIDAAKSIWQAQHIPIVFLTSYSDDSTIKAAMQSEPYAYLIKPYKDEELKATIKTSLHKHNYFFKNKDSLNKDSKNTTLIKISEELSFDKAKGILYKNETALKLTGNEVKLFEILSDYINEPVSFDKISSYIWREPIYDMGKLRNLVYRIKNKVGVQLFENIYETGYKLKIA